MLGLCFERVSLVVASRDYSLVVVHRLLIAVASLVALGHMGFSSFSVEVFFLIRTLRT